MATKPSVEEATSRQLEILDAAAKVFAEKGYERTTVRDLEEATGLTRGGIFFHFAGKRALYLAAIERACMSGRPFVREAALAATSGEEALVAAYRAIVAWHRDHPEAMQFFQQMHAALGSEPDIAEFHERMNANLQDYIAGTVRELQERHLFRAPANAEAVAEMVHGTMDRLVERALARPAAADAESEAFARQVFAAMGPGLQPSRTD